MRPAVEVLEAIADGIVTACILLLIVLPLLSQQAAPRPAAARRVPLIKPTVAVGSLKESRPAGRRGLGCDAAGNGSKTEDRFLLAILGPDRSFGATSSPAPNLYWYVSMPLADACEARFTLTCDPFDQPSAGLCAAQGESVEIVLPRPAEPGLQRIELSQLRLGSQPVELRRGTRYRWYVSVAKPASPRSADVVDHAFIEFLRENAPAPTWYDRVSAILDAYQPDRLEELTQLLEQVSFAPATVR